ncbi:hypothetical protein LMxysn_2024 [Listeria monocytogenes]|nr:hypothetical protein LMxysn_2024 [Listeria monocytogenes]EEW18809.1 predicted protein [Listeria monocytogenes FSL R2-503]
MIRTNKGQFLKYKNHSACLVFAYKIYLNGRLISINLYFRKIYYKKSGPFKQVLKGEDV